MKALTTAIFSKCTSATDLYTDIGGRLYKARAPERAEYPFAVFMVVSDVLDNTFTEDLENVVVQFSLFSLASSSGDVEDMFTHLKTLYDDCTLSPTGYSVLWMKRQQAVLQVEDHTTTAGTEEAWAYHIDYSILSKKD
jgi:hypothetical protein